MSPLNIVGIGVVFVGVGLLGLWAGRVTGFVMDHRSDYGNPWVAAICIVFGTIMTMV